MKAWLFSPLLFLFATRCFGSDVGITTTRLPNGTVNTEYSGVISASGGCTPYKWAVVSGKLPAGLAEKPSTHTMSIDLSGTPASTGTYSFSVSVTGCGGTVSTKSYEVVIQATANHVVDLRWNASTSSNIVGYNVYRSANETTWSKINDSVVPSTLFSDSTVANGSTYYYALTAVNVPGDESSKTAATKVVIP
jgi:hypothetical protein